MYHKRKVDDFERQRVLNYEFAGLIAHAHHQPDKMPEYRAVSERKQANGIEVQQAGARGALIAMAMRGK